VWFDRFEARNPLLPLHSTVTSKPNKKDNDTMTMKFLLHKDKKDNMEIATAQMAHLVFADTRANAQKTKRAISCQRSTE